MTGTLIRILVVLLLVGPALAADESAYRQGILFEIRPPSGAESSVLFGTIHSDDPRVLDLPGPVRERFDASPAFVMEVVPDAQAIIKSMMTMVYTDGRTLQDVLSSGLYRETVAAMAGIGMPESAFKDFKPWAVVTILSVPSTSTGEFLDIHLYNGALKADKTVGGLETIEEQLSVFDDLTEDEQVVLLRETLSSRAQLPEIFERLLAAYLERDLARLLALSDRYLRTGDPAVAERFHQVAIEQRNLRMFNRMRPLLERGGQFIAVGALHLPGESGLLSRLAGAGFAVLPLY